MQVRSKNLKSLISGITIFAAIAVMISILSFTPAPRPAQRPVLKTIIIDAGHGGKLAGTHGLISREQDVTLDIALKLGKVMEKEFPELKIVYTRTTDATVLGGNSLGEDLNNRAKIANDAKGDLFISIHCNATPQPAGGWYAKRVIGYKNKVTYVGKGKKRRKKTIKAPIYESYWVKNMRVGTETYVWAADRSSSKGEAINQKDEGGEHFADSSNAEEVFEMNSPEAKIRAQIYEKKYFSNSVLLASYVEDEFRKAGRKSFGVKQRDKGIRVLQATGMPSVLVEAGFLTNKEEEEFLNSEEGQDEVVSNILAAFRRYKNELESPKTTNSR